MTDSHTRGEMHGCIVCGKLYELYVVYGRDGHFTDAKVMSTGGKLVPNARRPLVACQRHTTAEIQRAVQRAYGEHAEADD